MEVGEALLFGHVGVPHSDCIFDGYLTHEQTIHPSETKLHEFHALAFQMLRQAGINTRSQIAQRTDLADDPRLSKDIVILYPIEQFRQTPKRIRLHGIEDRFGKLAWIHAAFDVVVRDIAAEEDLPERGDEIVDALYVAARWVADRPDVEDAFEGALCGFVAVELEVGTRTGDVDGDLVPEGFVEAADASLGCGCSSSAATAWVGGGASLGESLADAVEVGFAFSFEGGDAAVAAGGEVAEEELPGHGADFGWDAGPGGVAEFGDGDGAGLEDALEFVDS